MKVPVVSGRSMTKRGACKLNRLKDPWLLSLTQCAFVSLRKKFQFHPKFETCQTQIMDSRPHNWMPMHWLLQKKANLMSVVFNENVPRMRYKSSSCLHWANMAPPGLDWNSRCHSSFAYLLRSVLSETTGAVLYPKENPWDPNRFFFTKKRVSNSCSVKALLKQHGRSVSHPDLDHRNNI